MTPLDQTNLSKKVITALTEQGIDSVEKLCSFSLDDLEILDGIGPKALMQIAKIKEAANLPQIAAPAPAEAKAEPEYMTKEPPPELATVTTKTFKIDLQFRHADWIERAAEAYEMTEAQVIEQAIRQAYQRDPYKAGDTAVSGSVLKHDNPHRQKG